MREIRNKLILEGAEEYRQGIRKVTQDIAAMRHQLEKAEKAATRLTRALEKLAELRSKNSFYRNDYRESAKNAYYPTMESVSDCDSFKQLVCFDHTVVKFKNDYRKNDNFLTSDCAMFDVDNTHSENPGEWITPQNVRDTFPGVPFYVCFSRNHMKEKDGKQARPKFLEPLSTGRKCPEAAAGFPHNQDRRGSVLTLPRPLLLSARQIGIC